jgi:hypothetical protein
MHFAAALLAGLLLMGATAVPVSATIFGAAQSVCLLPAVVALEMSSSSITPDDPLSGAANCLPLCQKWVSACKGAVTVAKSCFNAALTRLSTLQNAVCDANTDPALQTLCRSGVVSAKTSAKIGLEASVADGMEQCEGNGLGACLIHCQ